jgi:hypothetical protein
MPPDALLANDMAISETKKNQRRMTVCRFLHRMSWSDSCARPVCANCLVILAQDQPPTRLFRIGMNGNTVMIPLRNLRQSSLIRRRLPESVWKWLTSKPEKRFGLN